MSTATLSQPLPAAVPAPSPSRRLVHFTELDGLRGIAAIIVFFHHLCYTSINPAGWNPFVTYLHNLSRPGDAGVDLFFVLSGFLITSLLLEARDKPSYYHDFYWKRVLRILPLYALCLLGVFFFVPGSHAYVLLSALFISNFALFFHVASSGPFWTLAIEEQFYLIWPAFLRRRPVAQLRRWALTLAFSSVALRLAAAAIGHHTFYYTFFRCDGLAGGAYLAFWLYERGRSRAREKRITQNLFSILAFGAVLCGLSLWKPMQERHLPLFDALYQTGITLLCIFLITFAITRSGDRKLAFLRSPFLTFFGLISYALYMVHLYVMYSYDALRGPLPIGDTAAYLLRLATILAITLILCLISRFTIELPANSLRKYVLAPHAPSK